MSRTVDRQQEVWGTLARGGVPVALLLLSQGSVKPEA